MGLAVTEKVSLRVFQAELAHVGSERKLAARAIGQKVLVYPTRQNQSLGIQGETGLANKKPAVMRDGRVFD